jgi:mannose-6-phosphate isomerase-like protein (cupin superfamily)
LPSCFSRLTNRARGVIDMEMRITPALFATALAVTAAVSLPAAQSAPSQPAPSQPAPQQPAPPKSAPKSATPPQTSGQTPRRPVGTAGGTATFAISVTDSAGAPLDNVRVIVQGPANREVRTEFGRIALENLPSGAYRLRFEREGFVTLERELAGRGGAPIDVKVTLTPAPPPPKPAAAPAPVAPPPAPAVKADPVALDILAFLEKKENYVGRTPAKNSQLGCSGGGTATLMQFNESVTEHAHADADEYLYVVAGTGTVRIGAADQPLAASVFVQIPRTMTHTLTVKGKTPLIVLSIKAGEPCGVGTAQPAAVRR